MPILQSRDSSERRSGVRADKSVRTPSANKPLDNASPQAETKAVMPPASQRYSADTIISSRAALGVGTFVGFSRTLIGQAPGRESQFRMSDPVLPPITNR